MSFWETAALAVSLGLDTFAAGLSLGIAARADRWRVALRLAALLAVLHVLAPLLGWLAARPLRVVVEQWAPWLALALLVYAGARMIREGLEHGDDAPAASVLDHWPSLALLCLALSLDVIAVGVSLGLAGRPIWPLAGLALVATFALSLTGALLGGVASRLIGRRAPIVGGLLLIYIGVRILLEGLA